MNNEISIQDLHAEIDGEKILKGINLTIKSGEIHTVMGPNGSGKSTLCKIIMGHPAYKVTKGSVRFNGTEVLELKPNERANLGLFLAFQQPVEVPGVTFGNFLRTVKNSNQEENISPQEFVGTMKEKIKLLKMDKKFIGRSVNEGFSGGEKKRAEIIQMATLEPKIALLDEIDSGLDIDALKIVSNAINKIHKRTHNGILMITHYQRILNYIEPDHVHIMAQGKIVKSGHKELAQELEKEGYEKYIK